MFLRMITMKHRNSFIKYHKNIQIYIVQLLIATDRRDIKNPTFVIFCY